MPGFVLGAEPIGVWQLGVAVRPGQDISLDPSAPFENLVVGAVEGYGYGEDWIEDYVAAHGDDPSRVQLLSGAAALSTNLRKLAAGRVDCVPDSVGVLRYHTHELRLDGQVEVVPASQERSEVFVAFSPKNPRSPEWAALLDRGVRELRASGRYRQSSKPTALRTGGSVPARGHASWRCDPQLGSGERSCADRGRAWRHGCSRR